MLSRKRRNYFRGHSTFELNITAMVDMFTILLVFLLKSYSTSAVQMEVGANLVLPASSSQAEPIEALKLVISRDAVFIDNKKILDLKNGQVQNTDLDSDGHAIKKVFDELQVYAKRTRDIASQNKTVEFDGKLILQADQNLPYAVLKRVVYTAMLAGYSDLKLATIAKD